MFRRICALALACCMLCGIAFSEETPHTHAYTAEVTKAASCTEAGVKTFVCGCGDSYTEVIPAKGHAYADGVCTVCGAADPDAPKPAAEPPAPAKETEPAAEGPAVREAAPAESDEDPAPAEEPTPAEDPAPAEEPTPAEDPAPAEETPSGEIQQEAPGEEPAGEQPAEGPGEESAEDPAEEPAEEENGPAVQTVPAVKNVDWREGTAVCFWTETAGATGYHFTLKKENEKYMKKP